MSLVGEWENIQSLVDEYGPESTETQQTKAKVTMTSVTDPTQYCDR